MDKLAVLGPEGTFSDMAAGLYRKSADTPLQPVYYPTIDAAFHAVGRESPYGVIPIENTLDGYVQRTLDLLLEMDVHIMEEISVPVQFSFVANCADPAQVKRVYAQFKAQGQCRGFLDSLGGDTVIETTQSNMESFHRARGGEAGDGAIIPAHMLPGEGGFYKVDNVTDAADNFTRFVVIKQGPLEPVVRWDRERVRAALYVMPETDRPGILFDILRVFYDQQVNMVSIMSRPTKKSMGAYNFFIEVDGPPEDRDKILRLLIALKAKHIIKVLGVYSK